MRRRDTTGIQQKEEFRPALLTGMSGINGTMRFTKIYRRMAVFVFAIIFMFAVSAEPVMAGSVNGPTITPSNSSYSAYKWYGHIDYSVSYPSDTTARITVTLDFRTDTSRNWGEVGKYVYASININGRTVSSVSSGSQSWRFIRVSSHTVATGYLDIARTSSVQNITVSGSVGLITNSAYDNTRTPASTASGTQQVAAIPVPSYTVYHNANGGELDSPNMGGLLIAADGSVMYNGARLGSSGTSIDLYNYNNPSGLNIRRTGYHINAGAEWNSRADGTGVTFSQDTPYPSQTFTNGQTVYANWKPNTYTVKYYPNADNAEGSMTDQTFTYDKDDHVRASSFVNPGFKLVGWSTDPDASPGSTLTVRGNQGTAKNLTAVNNGTVSLYAVWRPIEDSEADIYAGKTLMGAGVTDSFSFRIEPVEGWRHENESTSESGQNIAREELPMPEDTPDGQLYKDISITGFRNNTGSLLTESFGLISFEDPGWYMYRVSELIPTPQDNMVVYDRTSYYVVVYVEYKEDTGYKVRVANTTAWHNSSGSSGMRPDLEDIASITDNRGTPAAAAAAKTYGKVGIGTNGIVVRFWNTDYRAEEPPPQTASVHISKNVTGSLGDTSKQFGFKAVFSGLKPGTTYAIYNEDAVLESGFAGNSFSTSSAGTATVYFRLKDNTGFGIEDLPLNSKFEITEEISDHFPSYKITREGTEVKSEKKEKHSALSTGTVTMDQSGTYQAEFTNERDIAVNSGAAGRTAAEAAAGAGIMLASLAGLCIMIRRKSVSRDHPL